MSDSDKLKDPDIIKKRTKKLYDANYVTRPGSAQFNVSQEQWDKIFKEEVKDE